MNDQYKKFLSCLKVKINSVPKARLDFLKKIEPCISHLGGNISLVILNEINNIEALSNDEFEKWVGLVFLTAKASEVASKTMIEHILNFTGPEDSSLKGRILLQFEEWIDEVMDEFEKGTKK